MGADREGRGRRRPVRVAVCAGGAAVLLAGCASMPDSGDLRDVESTPRQDAQVRVFALPPRDDAQPLEIVQGFLEALTSDDPNYETARKYLTGKALTDWRPNASTTVLAEGPNPLTDPSATREDDGAHVYRLTGLEVARVDAQNAYEPADGRYSETVHLTRLKDKQWRIDRLPQGVVMGKSDFERTYVSVNKYYFTSSTQLGQLGTVADPVYVRRQVNPVTQMVRSLLKGPTRWLDPVARSTFPPGTALKKGVESLTPDDRNKLTVPLNGKADHVTRSECDEMAAQVLLTLQDLTPTGVTEVELQRSDGERLCAMDEDHAEVIAAHGAGYDTAYEYFIDDDGRLVRMSVRGADPDREAVPGALGSGERRLRSAAVARDEDRAAGVSFDGSDLYVGSLASGASLGDPVLHSEGRTEGDRLTTPSWDGGNDLWIADRDPDSPRLLMLRDGGGEPVEVTTPGLDGRIEAVRVAADGVRIALIAEQDGKRSSLLVGRIEREADGSGEPSVSIVGLRSVTPQLEEVTAMSWAGDSRLVVVGREVGGVQQMRYVQVDGSMPDGPELAALTGVQEIAASEDERLPLVAHSEDGIVRLSSGSQWQQVVEEGSAPIYPG